MNNTQRIYHWKQARCDEKLKVLPKAPHTKRLKKPIKSRYIYLLLQGGIGIRVLYQSPVHQAYENALLLKKPKDAPKRVGVLLGGGCDTFPHPSLEEVIQQYHYRSTYVTHT